jgi:GTP cyclohydrolase I
MNDVQSRIDERKIDIEKVGVKNLRYPVTVLDKKNRVQHTVATINMYAHLADHLKGTHMSRFIEVFSRYYADISMNNFLDMLDHMRESLGARKAFAEVSFPYFIEKTAPVSGEKSIMDYTCQYIGEVGTGGAGEDMRKFYVGIQVPVNTVCPCSLEISDRGAHNQRGTVAVKLFFERFFWIEDIIKLIEESASSELYTLIKREDEKYITERAFDHPRFVEDLVREVTRKLERDGRFPWFSVEAENFESIHNHSAYAYVEHGKVVDKVGE